MAYNRKREWPISPSQMAVVMALIIAVLYMVLSTGGPERVSYSQFLEAVEDRQIAEAQIGESEIRWRLIGSQDWQVSTRIPGVDDSEIVEQLRQGGAEITGEAPSRFWPLVLSWGIPLVLLVIFWLLIVGRLGGRQQLLTIGRSQARVYRKGMVDVNFDDVAGIDEAKAELQEIVDILRNPARYQALGGRIPKGILLVGAPGTGKTLLARAVAGEAGVPFYSISGSEFVQMFVGIGAARVRDLFEQAKNDAPCLVFIDEIDTIGKLRGAATQVGGHEEREQTLNQLLSEMDGFDPSRGVIIMAATNRPDVLDPALMRPGRFDRQVVVDKPDMRGREEILKVHARGVKLAPEVDLHAIAAQTPGFAGAELANIINEAALLAARHLKQAVEMADLQEAIDRVMSGLERKSRILSDEEKEIVAHHEMGHALIALLLPYTDPVHRVSIIPRGTAALGMTLQLPLQDKYLYLREELEAKLAVLMGGRVAEELCLGRISTGAQNDLYQATQLARRMVRDFGMSERTGPLTFGDETDPFLGRGAAFPGQREYSEETARILDEEVKALVERNYQRAATLLEANKEALKILAQELKAKETLEGTELQGRLKRLKVEPLPFSKGDK
jgi:cell division protease FtsH